MPAALARGIGKPCTIPPCSTFPGNNGPDVLRIMVLIIGIRSSRNRCDAPKLIQPTGAHRPQPYWTYNHVLALSIITISRLRSIPMAYKKHAESPAHLMTPGRPVDEGAR